MQDLENHLLDVLDTCGVDLLCSLPCDRVKRLIALAGGRDFRHLPLTREEEGVGICAGAALAGAKPAMLIQSSGAGNMVNALCSLTAFYDLPLALFISQRGIHKEGIEAQVPLGRALPGLLDAIGIGHTFINTPEGLHRVQKQLHRVYSENLIHAFLLSPELWEHSSSSGADEPKEHPCPCRGNQYPPLREDEFKPELNRFQAIQALAPYIKGHTVICNIGVPSKELYFVLDQPSNFYMLGSMGMAAPIGLGVSLFTDSRVFVIDGDGSLLMNPGTLATIASAKADNLVIVAIDNSAYGSTGCQPTLTGSCVDLEAVAQGFGITNTQKAATREQISSAFEAVGGGTKGPVFVHIPTLPGNQPEIANIPLGKIEIKERFQQSLKT